MLQDGLTNLDKALAVNPNYDDAMAYENLLIRERADLRDAAEEYQADIRVADEWVQKVLATKKAKAEAKGNGGIAPGPAPNARVSGGGGGDRYPTPISRVDPVYPPLALQARVQGVVRLSLVVGTDGHPRNLQVISGHPLLIQAALDAVRQWVYPQAAAELQMSIDVPFVLP